MSDPSSSPSSPLPSPSSRRLHRLNRRVDIIGIIMTMSNKNLMVTLIMMISFIMSSSWMMMLGTFAADIDADYRNNGQPHHHRDHPHHQRHENKPSPSPSPSPPLFDKLRAVTQRNRGVVFFTYLSVSVIIINVLVISTYNERRSSSVGFGDRAITTMPFLLLSLIMYFTPQLCSSPSPSSPSYFDHDEQHKTIGIRCRKPIQILMIIIQSMLLLFPEQIHSLIVNQEIHRMNERQKGLWMMGRIFVGIPGLFLSILDVLALSSDGLRWHFIGDNEENMKNHHHDDDDHSSLTHSMLFSSSSSSLWSLTMTLCVSVGAFFAVILLILLIVVLVKRSRRNHFQRYYD